MQQKQDKLKAQRIRAGLTQAELAKLMGVSRPTIYLVEHGKHRASPGFRKKALWAFSRIFPGITMDDLFYLPEVITKESMPGGSSNQPKNKEAI